jgi:hypothetical protein
MQHKLVNFIVKNWVLLILFITILVISVFFRFYGHSDLLQYPFIVEVWGTFSDWTGTVANILTLIVAIIALYSWKSQKLYDLEIEAKANAWKATFYIYKFTSVPLTPMILSGDDEQRFKNLSGESEELAACYLESFIMEFVRKKHEEEFFALNTIAEKVKAQFYNDDKRKNIYSFYRLFVKSYSEIYNKAFEFQALKYKAYLGEDINEEQIIIFNDFFYKGGLQVIADKIGDAQVLVMVDPKDNHNKTKHFR